MTPDFEIMEQKLISHEQVCAERYKGIEQQFRASNARLKRIEVGLIGAAIALIGAMGWAINLLIGLVAKL
jgi:hypothetical protein